MLNKRSAKLLEYLLSRTEDSKYIVLKTSEILDDLKLADNAAARRAIVADVRLFIESEFVSCKYFDEDTVCLTSMPRGRSWVSQEKAEKKTQRNQWVIGAIVFVAALVGSFVGAVVAHFLFGR